MTYLSRYRYRYLQALVYMLQENLYDIAPFVAWYRRTSDFGSVMQRKTLVLTTKARLLLGWLIGLSLVLGALIGYGLVNQQYILAGLLFILLPQLLMVGVLAPLAVGTVLIQRPREKKIITKARTKLSNHQAVKIAIVGSFGKTTMKEILSTVLSEGKKVAATPGNMNTPLGISRFVDRLDGSEEVLIFELGEYYPGDIRDLCHLVQPDMGVITGINEAHLERFKSIEKTIATIYELADFLGDKPLWVNAESRLAADNLRTKNISYSRQGVGTLKVQHAKTGLHGTDFHVVGSGSKLRLHSDLLGLHNVGPLVAGIAVANHFKLDVAQIEAGIAKTKSFEHRMQPSESGGIWTIDDSYNGNPDGARVAIEFLKDLKDHRRVYVTPGLVEVGSATADVHRQIGRQLAVSVDMVILVSNSATPYIAEGLTDKNFKGEVLWYDDGLSCLNALSQITKPGDVVVLQNDWSDNYA